jgi:hypothetical protein
MEDSGQLDIALYHLKAAAAKVRRDVVLHSPRMVPDLPFLNTCLHFLSSQAKLTAKAIQHTVQEWPHLYPLLQIHPLFAIVPTSKVHGIRKR